MFVRIRLKFLVKHVKVSEKSLYLLLCFLYFLYFTQLKNIFLIDLLFPVKRCQRRNLSKRSGSSPSGNLTVAHRLSPPDFSKIPGVQESRSLGPPQFCFPFLLLQMFHLSGYTSGINSVPTSSDQDQVGNWLNRDQVRVLLVLVS